MVIGPITGVRPGAGLRAGYKNIKDYTILLRPNILFGNTWFILRKCITLYNYSQLLPKEGKFLPGHCSQIIWLELSDLSSLCCLYFQVSLDIPALMAVPLTTVISLSPTLPSSGFWYPERALQSILPINLIKLTDGWLEMWAASSKFLKDSLKFSSSFMTQTIFWIDVDKSLCWSVCVDFTGTKSSVCMTPFWGGTFVEIKGFWFSSWERA